MQDASADFEAAVEVHRTWVPDRMRTDWDGTGYGGDGTIDDLSPQMGETWAVDHTLDDGYPESVTFVSGVSVPELTAELTGRLYPPPAAPVTAAQYWSPLRTDSPLYGYTRDVAPLTLDVGLVTEAGREYARVFTGQVVNTPVSGGRAELKTISAARLKLMKLVQMPAFFNLYSKGIRATWPVCFNLAQCDIYAGPTIRTGTAWYVPMHGAAWAMIPSANTVFDYADSLSGPSFPYWNAYEQRPGDPSPILIDEVDWMRGPYVSAPDLQLTTDLRRALFTQELALETSAGDAATQAGNKGRLEMWVKGDATDVNTAPGGSASVTRLCSLWMDIDTILAPYIRMGVTPTRNVEVQVYDGFATRTLTSVATLPSDGEWHFVGCAYDMTADRLWTCIDTTVTSASEVMTTAFLPVAGDDFTAGNPVFLSALPVSDITFTVGAEANVDSYPLWRNDASFAPTATVEPSKVRLRAVYSTEPREAWTTIADYAKAELASVRLTELDIFEYLPQSWWVRDEQQTVVDDFDTARNMGQVDVDVDPTKIRNSIKVSYSEVEVYTYDADNGGFQRIFELGTSELITIPPGVTVLKFIYSGVGILPSQQVTMWDATPFVDNLTQVTLNTEVDGTGTYATSTQVEVGFEDWDATSATLRFNNKTAITWYLVNSGDFPALIIVGVLIEEKSTYVTDEDAASVAVRGSRALEVSAGDVPQTAENARRLARRLKMALRKESPTIGTDQQGVEVNANPLRQPGDLATVNDPETGVTGRWRLRGVHHKRRGADYKQQVVARRALEVMIIGEGLVGESLIGPGD
jgi:hypothetical protein